MRLSATLWDSCCVTELGMWNGEANVSRVAPNDGSLYVSYLLKDFCWKSFGKKQDQKYNTKEFEACVSNRIVTFPVLSSISTYLQFWQLCKQCMITSTSSYLLIKGCHLVSLLSSYISQTLLSVTDFLEMALLATVNYGVFAWVLHSVEAQQKVSSTSRWIRKKDLRIRTFC